ncbi:MAG: amidase [Chloroflexi bacterium]|nr:amidase [Chloroflexota bacterium]MCI0779658.1 amidase [Chloroflexota bacterium]MCI0823198.1 amidase [Chloroflexota bacterium]MCI0858158.1 amidase [Chloroflexota bacterium]MCI0865270.1 amidase [Chloroflexota bacterium]
MDKVEIPFLSATELSALIKSRAVSPVEAAEAYLDRIGQVDDKLNSYITVTRDEALEQARQAEREIAAGRYRGPMHGVPVGVKDQFYTKGIRTTGGSAILKDLVPDEDATVISNLKQAGAVLLGKLNMSEYAMGDAFHHPYGRPHNPWDLSRNPGTSSSGSGAATAAFLCATSLGEDTGGSIRGPAAFCGLVGIRPSWGRVSRYGVLGASWSMDTVGPISRTTADCAMTLAAIAGYDPKDPYTWNTPVPDYLAALNGEIRGLKVGVVQERVDSDAVEPEVRTNVVNAISVLGELGAVIQQVSVPLMVHAGTISSPLIMVDAVAVHQKGIDEHLDQYDHNIKIRLLTGSILPARAHHKAVRLRHMLRREILEALEKVDVLVMPTSSIPASPIPAQAGIGSKQEVLDGLSGRRSFTAPFNLANTPALSINCGFTSGGLPVGLQIAGKPFDEETLFRVAHAYEQATDWHTRRPPI